MSLLPVRLTTLLKLLLVYYVAYLTFFVCRQDYSESNDVVRYTCGHLNRSVYPVWTSQIQPRLDKLDKNYGISASVKPVVANVRSQTAALDEKYQISYTADKTLAAAKIWGKEVFGDIYLSLSLFIGYQYAKAKLYWEGNVSPVTQYYLAQYQKSWGNSINNFATKARINTQVYWRSSKRHVSRTLALHVVPYYHQLIDTLSKNKHVVQVWETIRFEKALTEIQRVYSILVQKSAVYSAKLQRKKDFLKAEINNFPKVDNLKKKWKRDTAKIVNVVNEILEDVTSSHKRVLDNETPIDVDNETGTEVEESIEEEFVDVDAEEPESDSGPSGSESSDSVESTAESGDSDAGESQDDSEEPEVVTFTATRTRTVTVVKNEPPPSQETAESEDFTASGAAIVSVELGEEDVTKYGEDSSKAQIEFELKYWKSKVDKTLDLAYNSLESEMKDALNTTIEELKEKISFNFTTLQLGNFARYKVMNELISAIDKDSQYIRESGKIIDEPEVDRQIMRDRIREAYDAVEGSMKDVEANLNDFHLEIMERYFSVVQDTVDVLESFADTTILDFSNRLSGLLEILETNADFEDELSWSAWKQFHKVKDLIFNIRDKIYNEAEEYKYNPRGRTKPNGLKAWDKYLDNINFHIKFLLTDNDEYLKLVRAKANIAYQLREGLTRELTSKAEAEALAKAEALAEAHAGAESEEKARADAIAEEEYLRSVNAKVSAANEAYRLQSEQSSVVLESVSSETTEAEQPAAAENEVEVSDSAEAIESSESVEAPESEYTHSVEASPESVDHNEPESHSQEPVTIEVPVLGEIIEEEIGEPKPETFAEQVQQAESSASEPVKDTIPTEPQTFDDDNIIGELEAVEDAPEALEATD